MVSVSQCCAVVHDDITWCLAFYFVCNFHITCHGLDGVLHFNLSKYLPFISDQNDNQQMKQYLLLHSLKEVCAHELSIYLRARHFPI